MVEQIMSDIELPEVTVPSPSEDYGVRLTIIEEYLGIKTNESFVPSHIRRLVENEVLNYDKEVITLEQTQPES